MQRLGETLRTFGSRPSIPSEMFCETCQHLVHTLDVIKWVTENRPDVAGMYCVCWQRHEQADRAVRERSMEANLPFTDDDLGPRTFETFSKAPRTQEMFKAAQDFANGKGPRILTLIGITGCGKTHMMSAIGHHQLNASGRCRYDQAEAFAERCRHTYSQGSDGDLADLMGWYASVPLLMLDELGHEPEPTPYARGHVTRLIDQRYTSGGRLVVGTNLKYKEMVHFWGDRLASRLYDTRLSKVIQCAAGDYRLTRRE